MVGSKLICSKWHFNQVGHEGKKNHMGDFFDKNSQSKKSKFLVVNHSHTFEKFILSLSFTFQFRELKGNIQSDD
jgi:hypothetical protein